MKRTIKRREFIKTGLAAGAADMAFHPSHAFYGDEMPDWLSTVGQLTDPGFTPGPREL